MKLIIIPFLIIVVSSQIFINIEIYFIFKSITYFMHYTNYSNYYFLFIKIVNNVVKYSYNNILYINIYTNINDFQSFTII